MQHVIEENSGRIYVNLTGGEAIMPEYPQHQQYPQQHQQHQQHQQQGYPGGQHQQQHQQQQQQQPDEFEQAVNAALPKIMRKLEKACCVVM